MSDQVSGLMSYGREAGECEAAARLWAEASRLYAAVGIEAGAQECSNHLAALSG